MKTALVIINGIKFPYFLVEHAIEWAKREGGSLHALFITAGEEVNEGYAFPSDMDMAETLETKEDVQKNSEVIIRDLVHLFNDMINAAGISGQSELLKDPPLSAVLEKAKQAAILFVAPGFDDIALLAVTTFKMQELIHHSPCPVEKVTEKSNHA
jgi:hypothetical protein